MDPVLIRTVIVSVGVVGFGVWLLGFVRAWRLFASGGKGRCGGEFCSSPEGRVDFSEVIVPAFNVKGKQEELLREIGKSLTFGGLPVLGQLMVGNVGHDYIEFSGRGLPGTGMGILSSVRGVFRVRQAGWEDCEISAEADFSRVRRRAGAITLVVDLAIALPVVVLLPALLYIFVSSHPNPGVRGQGFQVFQMIHVLWPPFFIPYIMHSRIHRMVVMAAEAVASRLRFAG